MSEETFNLIPVAYLQQRQMLSDARRFVLAGVVFLSVALAAWFWLSAHLSEHKQAVEQIVSEVRGRQARELDLQTLESLAGRLETRLHTLDALRGGYTGRELLRLIDAALNPGIRFRALRFERSDAAAASEGDDRADPSTATMSLSGDATNHVALGDFLSALNSDPWVERVDLLRSGSKQRGGIERVSFELNLHLRVPVRGRLR